MQSKSGFRVVLEPLAISVALALLVRGFCQIYAIPSRSMEPTYYPGDHIVVTTCDRPRRGDIVVFRAPQNENELMVKRVIATAGDLIEARDGRVVVSGRALDEPYVFGATKSIAPLIVPADSYFVMGDNRGDSFDSRNWGPLPRRLVVGRARMVLWPSRLLADSPAAHARSTHEVR